MKYFKLYITCKDSVGNFISKSCAIDKFYVELISTNMMANNPIRTWTLRNIHVSYNTHF